MKIFKKAILPQGYLANGISAGIKKSGKPDLALFYSESPALVSCKITLNKIKAAPLKLNQQNLKARKEFRAIVANSGNANAFTGKAGLVAAQKMAASAAAGLLCDENSVLVASTGIIAKKMPVEKIQNGIVELVNGLSKAGIAKAKKAIMTTDKFSKEITAQFRQGNKTVTICGVAKGAGMISPNLATMLVFIFTDANITKQALDKALKIAVENSFNCITVDGCMSTNDTVILMANKKAANALIEGGRNQKIFSEALNLVCLELAKMMVKDGEGASKFIKIKVSQSKSVDEAKKIALQIANSNLFKTAIYASSPNIFGRIVAAAGAAGADVKEDKLKVKYSSLKKKEIDINVSVGTGNSSAVIYASDLTPEYLKINAQYN